MKTRLVDQELISSVIERARSSPRRRMNYNFHTGPEDNPHRFLNVLLARTYIAPHRHASPPKAEMFVVLEGQVELFCFDDGGVVTERYVLGPPGPWGIDVPAGTWHTLTSITPEAVCIEVKPGPWDPASDKEFAPWAPREGDPGCEEYLDRLLKPR